MLVSSSGVTGVALDCFHSYLSGRSQTVSILNAKSLPETLHCGVPQGSALGPRLFTIYTLPISDIIRKHQAIFHLFADDTQLYLTCQRPSDPTALNVTLANLEACIDDICLWMPLNAWKLNDSKTEFLVLQSKNIMNLQPPDICIALDNITPSHQSRDLRVIIDDSLSPSPGVASVCKAASFQLCRISCICQLLTTDATKTLVHSLISPRLDYCNSVLAGLPNTEIGKPQCIQNAMDHLTTQCRKYDHITSVLFDLHWLPIKERNTQGPSPYIQGSS